MKEKTTTTRAAEKSRKPHIWVLTSGEVGMMNQAVGLAETSGYSFETKKVTLLRRYRFLPGHMAAKIAGLGVLGKQQNILKSPFPDIIIACGRRSIAASLAVKWQAKHPLFLVYIHHPRIPLELFDMVVPSYHDAVSGKHVYPTGPSLHRVNTDILTQARKQFQFPQLTRPLLAVMIGGNRRSHQMKLAIADKAGRQLQQLSKKMGIALSFSRRTPFPAWVGFMRYLHNQKNIFVWDGQGENPYFAMLAHADAFLVSAESISMISEAIFTGKPVYLLELPGRSKRFDHFHQWLYENDYCRPFTGKIELGWGKAIDDTPRIAAILRQQYQEFMDREKAKNKKSTRFF